MQRLENEAFISFEIMFRNWPGGTEQNHGSLGFSPGILRLKFRQLNDELPGTTKHEHKLIMTSLFQYIYHIGTKVKNNK